MARKPKNKLAENIGDFAGPDADRENIEKLAKAAEEANAKAGHNSGEPSQEVIRRNYDAIKVCLLEIAAAGRIMQAARAAYGAARKTAKTDFGAKSWVESTVECVQADMAAEKGGAGPMVSTNRQKATVFKAVESPLYKQLGFNFITDDLESPATTGRPAMDAELQGQHAYSNSEGRGNNPFQQGTEDFVSWDAGYMNAMAAKARSMGPDAEVATH